MARERPATRATARARSRHRRRALFKRLRHIPGFVVGQPTPELRLPRVSPATARADHTAAPEMVSLAAFRGRKVLLVVFASW